MPSLLQWGEEQQEVLLLGAGQKLLRCCSLPSHPKGKEWAKCHGSGCLFKSLAQPRVIHLNAGIVEQEDV